MAEQIKLNTKALDALVKAFKGNPPKARVGILAKKNARHEPGENNAEIGRKHEYGIGIVQRSFLRVPLIENLQGYLEAEGAFDKSALKKVVDAKSLTVWVKKLGVVGENVVSDAFKTGGFGKWKPSDMTHKKVHQTLVETQQLRNSISSEVVS